MFVVEASGRCVAANDAACEFTGVPRDELVGKSLSAWVIPELPPSVDRPQGGVTCPGQLRCGDGTCRRISVDIATLGDDVRLWVVREEDNSRTEVDALRQSHALFSTLINVCHACVISAGVEGRILTWNAAAERLFGYQAREAIGLSVGRLVAPSDFDLHAAAFDKLVASPPQAPIARVVHADGRRKDGTEFAAEVSVAVAPGHDGPVLTAVVRDVSDERRMLDELNDALQLLRFHVARMPLAYIVWDAEFRVTEWNPAAERIFGYTKADAMGRNAFDLVVPEDAHDAVDSIWLSLLKGDTSSHSINANNRKDGSRIVCEWFNTPLRDSRGRVHGVASMAMDVSEREAMESRIREAQKIESLGVLASGIAHDFNSALMVILGNVALLRACEGLPERSAEFIDLIEQAGDRADELIKHLLTYARTGRHNPQPTDVNAVIQDALKLAHAAVSKGHELVLELADVLPSIQADRSQVEQVILNLLMNASAATGDRGRITLATREVTLTRSQALRCVPHDTAPGAYVELCVTDDGCGMDESTVSRMFDPFFTARRDGHGLGMAAVLGILRQHDGAALVESFPGVGTKICVYLPVARPVNVVRRKLR